jgi:hypothetical protein
MVFALLFFVISVDVVRANGDLRVTADCGRLRAVHVLVTQKLSE